MYDTLCMRYIDYGVDLCNAVTPCLDTDTITTCTSKYNVCISGYIGNLKLTISPHQLRVKDGSICKWMLGDNYQVMTRSDTQQAFEQLSDLLHLPMAQAIITRLDVGVSMPVKEPIPNYLNHLGVLSRAIRLQQPTSLYYQRHSKAEILHFYDKNQEQSNKREPIPEIYKGCNVLRYELRYEKRLPKFLGVPEVTGELLYDEAFYMKVLNNWRDEYMAIPKINDITINSSVMKTLRNFRKMGVLSMVKSFGGEIEMINHINEAQKRGEFTAKQAFDLRKEVKEVCKITDGLTKPIEAIAELDKKIAEAIKYYR